MTVREVEPWRVARLKCGIGHAYGGRVRMVEVQGSREGEIFWYPPSREYDADRCIVCGLLTWSVVE